MFGDGKVNTRMVDGLAGLGQATRRTAHALVQRGSALVGGPARARVILLLATTLGLQGADVGTLSATANDLQRAFAINNTAIGLLVSVTALAGALGTMLAIVAAFRHGRPAARCRPLSPMRSAQTAVSASSIQDSR